MATKADTLERLYSHYRRERADIMDAMRHERHDGYQGLQECSPASVPWSADNPGSRDESKDYGCYRILPDGTRQGFSPSRDGTTRTTRQPADVKREALNRLLAIIGTTQADYD